MLVVLFCVTPQDDEWWRAGDNWKWPWTCPQREEDGCDNVTGGVSAQAAWRRARRATVAQARVGGMASREVRLGIMSWLPTVEWAGAQTAL